MEDERRSEPRKDGEVYGCLTQEECDFLANVALYSPEVTEREIDELRLEFARWLVTHGRLSEDV